MQAARNKIGRIRRAGLKGLSRRAVVSALPLMLCLLAAAAPLAQSTRFVEVEQARAEQSPRYAWVMAAQVKASQKASENTPAGDKSDKKSNQPRLIQVLTDNWDVSSGVHLPAMDVPPPAWALCLADEVPFIAAESNATVLQTGPPLWPTSRGPPVL